MGCTSLGYHVVWCPKYRRPVLAGRVAARCEELIRAKASEHGWRIVALEIMPDHVHLFVKAHPSDSPSRIASQFKGLTSRRLRAEFRTCGPACQLCGPGRIPRPRSAPCPRRPCAGIAACRTSGRGGRNGRGETRVQVPRLPDTPAGGARGAAARRSLRPVQRGAGGTPRSVAHAPGQRSATACSPRSCGRSAAPTRGGRAATRSPPSSRPCAGSTPCSPRSTRARRRGRRVIRGSSPTAGSIRSGFVAGDGAKWTSAAVGGWARVAFQAVGSVKVRQHRPVAGTVKFLQLKREHRRWYVIVITEADPEPPVGHWPGRGC